MSQQVSSKQGESNSERIAHAEREWRVANDGARGFRVHTKPISYGSQVGIASFSVAEQIAKKEWADLISAAPDLLEACKNLANRFESRVSDDTARYPELAAARAAIAKAGGVA